MSIGKTLIVFGLSIVFLGIVILFLNKITWFGNLFGDFKYESKSIKVYAPITSMFLLSLLLSFIINVLIKIFK